MIAHPWPGASREISRCKWVAIVNQYPLAVEEPCVRGGQVPRLLDHPLLGRAVGDAGDLYTPAGDVDDEKHKVADQALQTPGLDRKEIAGCEALPVASQERLPCSLVGLVGIGQQTVVQHHPADGLPGHVVAQALQLTMDVAVAPAWVVRRHLKHQLTDGVGLLRHRPTFASPIGPVVLAGDEPAMPAEQRLWGEERAEFCQQLPADLDGGLTETGPLRVVQTDAFLAELLPKNGVFRP